MANKSTEKKSVSKDELVRAMVDGTSLSLADGAILYDNLVKALGDAAKAGKEIRLTNFGSFQVKETAARTGRNPKTNEPVNIPAGRKLRFKASKNLFEQAN